MTGLNPDALVVSLVQVAASLPMFLFALPAGALADIIGVFTETIPHRPASRAGGAARTADLS